VDGNRSRDGDRFSFPVLPAGAPAFNPETLNAPALVVYALDVSFYAGYGDFKSGFASFFPTQGLTSDTVDPITPILPALGSARLTSVSTN
jgi:hypothetical protein